MQESAILAMGALAEGCLEGLAQRGYVNGFLEHLLAVALASDKVPAPLRARLPRGARPGRSGGTPAAGSVAESERGVCGGWGGGVRAGGDGAGLQPLVRSITCWTLSRYSEWICAPRRGQAPPPPARRAKIYA